MKLVEPYPNGTRVHHRGAVHSRGQDPEHPDGGLRGGWGKVLRSVKQRDRTYEYEIDKDRDIAGGRLQAGCPPGWWGSHHIDETRPLVSRA